MPHSVLTISALLFFGALNLGCAAEKPAASHQSVPGFHIRVTLSPRAASELMRRHETLVAFGNTFGRPARDAPRRIISEEGEIDLGTLHAEFQPGQTADIPSLSLDRSRLRYTTAADVQLLVNVVSGRKSSPDNLLDCEIYEGPLQKIQSQTLPLHCRLIGE